MGGIDKADMLCSIYGINRKSKKWWYRLFFVILDRTLINAMIAYNKLENANLATLLFRRYVAQSLIILSHKPSLGRPLRTPPLLVKKRRKTNYSVSRAMKLESRGAHWIVYGKKGTVVRFVHKIRLNHVHIVSVSFAKYSCKKAK